jgi:hypothetical protein
MNKDQETAAILGASVVALYASGLSAWRLSELASLPSDVQIHPDFPQWLVAYLWAICGSLFVLGIATIVISALVLTGRIRSRLWFLLPALGMTFWIAIHGVFSLHDKAVGQGGMVWGLVHSLTLTRIFSEATEFGLVGYRNGQVVGLLIWCLFPFILFAVSGVELGDSPSQSLESCPDESGDEPEHQTTP